MKIKLSKNQWESIGKKAGWINNVKEKVVEAQTSNDQPVVEGYYEDGFPKIPKLEGYYLIKEHQKWGYCPTYRSKTDPEDIWYYEDGKFYRWEELKEHLRDVWRPPGQSEQDWFVTNL